MIGRVVKGNKALAAAAILCHGKAATYQVGWSSRAGREASANHLLLWQALGLLKDKGITDFDLGGVNDDTAKGIKQFKAGLGGDLQRLAGLYV
jgi:lipid II:glycine glycyltransferase (peptidoglycan interpeptide bridge formation enzyme)